MKSYFRSTTTTFCLIFFLFSLSGCASWLGARVYSGEPLPRRDVAFIYMADLCQVGGITREGQGKMNFLMWGSVNCEILPGNYILELRYYSSGTYSTEKGGTVNLPLSAEAGHVYYISAEHPSPHTWRPFIIDIVSNEDYARILDRNPKSVKEKVEEYFQGERIPMQKSEYQKMGGGVIKLWH